MPSLGEVAILVLEGIGQTVGIRAGTEEPRYAVVERLGDVEIRRYAPRIAAETTVTGPEVEARNAGFRRVAGYIFGGNSGRANVAMTAPVAQAATPQTIAMTAPVAQTSAAAGAWRVQFFMPVKYTLETLPAPTDPSVRLVRLPEQTFAALRFTGSRKAGAVGAKSRVLGDALRSSGRWRAADRPAAWFYDPPWTIPFLRRNEVAAPVEPTA